MNQTAPHPTQKGVICLFCGASTTLPAQSEHRHALNPAAYLFSIVRCDHCGKEALYLPDEIIRIELECPPPSS